MNKLPLSKKFSATSSSTGASRAQAYPGVDVEQAAMNFLAFIHM